MTLPETLRKITEALDGAGIAYMLTGSIASAHHGALRSTQDIDVVIEASASHLRAFIQGLSSREYYADLDAALEALSHESMFNVIDLASGWKIDLIIRKSRLFSREEFRRRQLTEVQGAPVFVASAEDVVITKLEWAKLAESHRQIEDVASILRLRGSRLDDAYLMKWISELGLQEQWTLAQRLADINRE